MESIEESEIRVEAWQIAAQEERASLHGVLPRTKKLRYPHDPGAITKLLRKRKKNLHMKHEFPRHKVNRSRAKG
jgi:hypothetical protein